MTLVKLKETRVISSKRNWVVKTDINIAFIDLFERKKTLLLLTRNHKMVKNN